jgi:hypothetical protein
MSDWCPTCESETGYSDCPACGEQPPPASEEYEIGDLVTVKESGEYLSVTGVIHDSQRLFVIGNHTQEFEVLFSNVESHWVRKQANQPAEKGEG